MSMTLYPKCTHCENPTKKTHTLIQTYIALIDFIILYHIIVTPSSVKPTTPKKMCYMPPLCIIP